MKKFNLLFITTILLTISANSQITKGNWMVGGSGNLTNTKIESKIKETGEVTSEPTHYSVVVRPNLGYFIVDQFAIGATSVFSYSKTSKTAEAYGYGIGPYARYYFFKPEKRINMLAQIGYLAIKFSPSTSTSQEFLAKVGPVIYFNSSVGLEMTLDYSNYISNNNYSKSTFKDLGISLGFQIHLEK